jgi:hypothetical protein
MGHCRVKDISHQKGQSYIAEVQDINMKCRTSGLIPQLV